MVRYIVLLAVITGFTVGCKKSVDKSSPAINQVTVEGAAIIKTGTLNFHAENNTNGLVNIYQQPDGSYVLAFEQMNLHSELDLEVYLSKDSDVSQGAAKLFSFQSINGTLFYALPANFDVSAFDYVIIQNDILGKEVASAAID